MKSKTGARFEHATHELLPYLQLTELCGKLSNSIQIRTINENHLYCLFRKEECHIMEESHSPWKIVITWLIVCCLSSVRKKYSIHMGISTLASRTTFLQCLWPMSREGSLSCHTCYDRKYVFLRTFSYKGLYYKQWLLISYNNRLKEILYWKYHPTHPHTQKHHLELYWVGHLFIEQDISYMELYVTLYVRKISEILP